MNDLANHTGSLQALPMFVLSHHGSRNRQLCYGKGKPDHRTKGADPGSSGEEPGNRPVDEVAGHGELVGVLG